MEFNYPNADALVEQTEMGRYSTLSSSNDACTEVIPDWQGNIRPSFFRRHRFALVGFLTVGLIVGLSYLTSIVTKFVPNSSPLDLASQVSCDLTTAFERNGSAMENAFTINLRAPTHFTFAQAKALDLAWQLILGAGGRFLMAWLSYVVFMDGLARIMETSSVSYQLYVSLTFSTTSLFTLWDVLQGLVTMKGWRPKIFLAWFCLSCSYVLVFQTLMSATAGYVVPSSTGFSVPDGALVKPGSNLLSSCFNMTAGALVGLQNGTSVQGPPVHEFNVMDGTDFLHRGPRFSNSVFNGSYSLFFTMLQNSMRPNLSDSNRYTNYRGWTSNITILNHTYVFQNYTFGEGVDNYYRGYCYNNQSYCDPQPRAECLPESYFVWGLSSLLVQIVLSTLIVWFTAMALIWLDANVNSELCRNDRRIRGPFRPVADLSEAMREVIGPQPGMYSDQELWQRLRRQPGLRYYASDDNDTGLSRVSISSVRTGKVALRRRKAH